MTLLQSLGQALKKLFRIRDRKIRIVLDTNIIISALTNPNSASAEILKMALEDKSLNAFATEDILDEYRHILKPFEFVLKPRGGYENFLSELSQSLKIVKSKTAVRRIKEDPSDNKFLECALAAKADFIVTSDRHFNFKSFRGIKIVNSAELLKIMNDS